MKKIFYGLCLMLILLNMNCRKNSIDKNSCADTDEARIDLMLYDAKTGKELFGSLGSNTFNNIRPEEINMYEEGFTPFLLGKCSTCQGGTPWNQRYFFSDGYVSGEIKIPYVERNGHTSDSVGKPIFRTYYLKMKEDIDTIRINYHMDNTCSMKNYFLQVYYNDSLYVDVKNTGYYRGFRIYKK